MISDSQTRYGSRVPCQGKAWRPCSFCQATRCAAKWSGRSRRSLMQRAYRGRGSSLALLHLLDRDRVIEQRQVELDECGIGGQRRREGVLAQRLGQLDGALLILLQALVLQLDLVDARLELAGRGLHLLERLGAPLEALPALAQLGIDL